jgi:hypothetical protein
MSDEPPATKGMITWIGFDGNGCACTAKLATSAALAKAQRSGEGIRVSWDEAGSLD